MPKVIRINGAISNEKSFLVTQATTVSVAFKKVYTATIGGACGENVYWALTDEGTILHLFGTGATAEFTGDTPWSDYNDTSVRATVDDGVTRAGSGAFRNSALAVAFLDSSVTSVGAGAVLGCADFSAFFYRGQDLGTLTIDDGNAELEGHVFLGDPTAVSVDTEDYYYAGAVFQPEAVNVTLSSGSTARIDRGFTVTADLSAPGDATISVRYLDLESEKTVPVVEDGFLMDATREGNNYTVTVLPTENSVVFVAFYDSVTGRMISVEVRSVSAGYTKFNLTAPASSVVQAVLTDADYGVVTVR
jgi:hypothetical protein